MASRFELKDRSDQQLLTGAKVLASRERESTAQLIAYLSEIDARELYLGEGCGSLFKYCTEVLHLSEDVAGNRIIVARLAQKYPIVLTRLAEGAIHLSALRILAPCLTPQNHLGLLDRAKHKSKDQVEEIAAAVRPRPDVPSAIRKLPDRGVTAARTNGEEAGLFSQKPEDLPATTRFAMEHQGVESILPVAHVPAAAPAPPRRATVSALSPGRYKIEFTADAVTHDALRELQELMRHQVPNGDPAKIFKKALLLLLDQVRAEKTGQGRRSQKRKPQVESLWVEQDVEVSSADEPAENVEVNAQGTQPEGKPHGQPSRHIPAKVKRSVWERDKGRCTFVGRNGKRCTSTGWLEYHHLHAYAMGGPATIDNIALRCRAHNAYESRQLFGGNGKKVTRPGACSSSRLMERNSLGPGRVLGGRMRKAKTAERERTNEYAVSERISA